MNLHPVRRQGFQISVALAAFTIVLIAAFKTRPPEEPQLNGKPLSHYLDLQTYGELRTEREARASITDFGSNAVPHLIRILEYQPTRLDSLLENIAPHIPFFHLRRTPFEFRQLQAILACSTLGPKAATAVPALSNLVNHQLLGEHAISALANLGPDAFSTLTNALATGAPLARAAAAGALRSHSVASHSDAVAPLLRALHDPSLLVRVHAASSLALVAPGHPETLRTLMEHLEDKLPLVRIPAIIALGWMREKAAPSVSRLRELLRTEEDPALHLRIEQALDAINSKQTPAP